MRDEELDGRYLWLLRAAGVAVAAGERLDVAELVSDLEVSAQRVRLELDELSAYGFVDHGLSDGSTPTLLKAGRQFLSRLGAIDESVLAFLPNTIGDLFAREALLAAGSLIVDRVPLRAAGDEIDYAREVVPPAFVTAVDDRLALDLFAAAVALMARLSNEAPAGCVAEEIVAVKLLEEARYWLESDA